MKKKRKRKQVGRAGAIRGRTKGQGDDAPTREKILRGSENLELPPEEASQTELSGDVREGLVVAIRGPDVRVETGDEIVTTMLRKSTRVPHAGASAVVVGDRVRYLAEGDQPYMLTEIEKRRSTLTRTRRGREEHVLCANVDVGAIVTSVVDPPFKPRLVDRYLLSLTVGGIEPLLILNKIDLVEPEAVEPMLAPYAGLDLPVVATSAESGAGLEELELLLRGRIAVFSGQSGVGKSTLLNRLGGLELETAEVHDRSRKGKHTTTHSTLLRFPFGGGMIDTPGIKSFALHEPTPEAMESFFPEIFALLGECRFRDCAHRGDHGCALPEAVERGEVHADRLESFLALLEEIQ